MRWRKKTDFICMQPCAAHPHGFFCSRGPTMGPHSCDPFPIDPIQQQQPTIRVPPFIFTMAHIMYTDLGPMIFLGTKRGAAWHPPGHRLLPFLTQSIDSQKTEVKKINIREENLIRLYSYFQSTHLCILFFSGRPKYLSGWMSIYKNKLTLEGKQNMCLSTTHSCIVYHVEPRHQTRYFTMT